MLVGASLDTQGSLFFGPQSYFPFPYPPHSVPLIISFVPLFLPRATSFRSPLRHAPTLSPQSQHPSTSVLVVAGENMSIPNSKDILSVVVLEKISEWFWEASCASGVLARHPKRPPSIGIYQLCLALGTGTSAVHHFTNPAGAPGPERETCRGNQQSRD